MIKPTEGMTLKVCDVCGELRCMVDAERAAKWLDGHKAKAHKVGTVAVPAKPHKAAQAQSKPVAWHVGDVVTVGNRATEYTVTDVRERSPKGKKGHTELEIVTKNNRARVVNVEKDNVVRVRAKRGRPAKA